jgi:ribosomal protein L20A (L18A)
MFHGKFDLSKVDELLKTKSYLGEADIEGFVVKNYHRPFLLGGQPISLMAGKYVSEGFKEKHKADWGKEHSTKGKWEVFKDSYRTEARWHKAIQHLKERGLLEFAPRDIGALIKEIQNDIAEEEKEDIKEFLWKEFGQEVIRVSAAGFPEFYKRYLLNLSSMGAIS